MLNRHVFRELISMLIRENHSSLISDYSDKYQSKNPNVYVNIQHIAASLIQFYFRKHRLNSMKMFLCEKIYEIKQRNCEPKRKLFACMSLWCSHVKNSFKDLICKLIVVKAKEDFEEICDKMKKSEAITKTVSVIKKRINKNVLAQFKRNYTIAKYCAKYVVDDYRYTLEKYATIWKRKAKLLKRKDYSMMKMIRVLRKNSKKCLLLALKFNYLKLSMISFAMIKNCDNEAKQAEK